MVAAAGPRVRGLVAAAAAAHRGPEDQRRLHRRGVEGASGITPFAFGC